MSYQDSNMYWRSSELNQTQAHIQPPKHHELDPLLLMGMQNEESFKYRSKYDVQEFTCHEERQFGLFLNDLNSKSNKLVYASLPQLHRLGIVINLEVGYLVHISSLLDTSKNLVFCYTKNLRDVIKNIIDKCNYKLDTPDDPTLVIRWIDCLFTSSNFEINGTNRTTRFPITFTSSLGDKETIGKEKQRGHVSVLQSPEYLIAVHYLYRCEICLKAFQSAKMSLKHINSTHEKYFDLNAIDYVGRSYCQMYPSGLISILASENFDSLCIKARSRLNSYNMEGTCSQVKYSNTYFTISGMRSDDEMFKVEKTRKFFEHLNSDDVAFYFDYLRMNTRILQIKNYLQYILFHLILKKSEAYKYKPGLLSHKTKVLKFYSTLFGHQKFNFNKISNHEVCQSYTTILVEFLLSVLFLYKNVSVPILCNMPNYIPKFSETQKILTNRILQYISVELSSFKLKHHQVFKYDEDFIVTNSIECIWGTLKELLISLSLGCDSTLIRGLFLLQTGKFDHLSNKLILYHPRKRFNTFKGLLYFIRLALVDTIDHGNDKEYYERICLSTLEGSLKIVMEELYYPTAYYFLKSYEFEMQPFFCKETLTLVHPVFLRNSLVGCKIVGPYSVRILVSKIESTIDNLIWKSDVSIITNLLIGFLILSNPPLPFFDDYLKLNISSFVFKESKLEILTENEPLIVTDPLIFNSFLKYTQLYSVLGDDRKYFFRESNETSFTGFSSYLNFKYTSYQELVSLLCSLHRHSLEYWDLINTSQRQKGEGYLIVNLEKVASDYESIINQKSNVYVDLSKDISLDDVGNDLNHSTVGKECYSSCPSNPPKRMKTK